MTKLTYKQQTVLDYLQRYLGEHRRAPFLREIQEACGIVSYKSVIDRLNALEHKGVIKRVPNKHRGIKLIRRVHEPPQPPPQLVQAVTPAEGRL